MALGWALTVGAAWLAYRSVQLRAGQREREAEAERGKQVHSKFAALLDEARRREDAARLRALTLEYAREAHADPNGTWAELGALPGLPPGDRDFGKETIPAEDTLVFVRTDAQPGRFPVHIAVNVEARRVCRVPPTPKHPADPWEGALAELFARVNFQAAHWRDEGFLPDGTELAVSFILQDRILSISYICDSYLLETRDGQKP
ncbi:hypothetical protein GGS23DRAFT_615909 [Durotheca rogersii]|uniref:uncharacterized protein n=1 Tax=Durotheca rogersii TaxID=419775 RepID=UPI002220BCF3|nr:uncharacterized protein GGS23DRAFT_615909 [Durotheca rogersii]KAI5859528.1 hypothetical protein GGS23DRAFT_615909 [Durotheca rogersii]